MYGRGQGFFKSRQKEGFKESLARRLRKYTPGFLSALKDLSERIIEFQDVMFTYNKERKELYVVSFLNLVNEERHPQSENARLKKAKFGEKGRRNDWPTVKRVPKKRGRDPLVQREKRNFFYKIPAPASLGRGQMALRIRSPPRRRRCGADLPETDPEGRNIRPSYAGAGRYPLRDTVP